MAISSSNEPNPLQRLSAFLQREMTTFDKDLREGNLPDAAQTLKGMKSVLGNLQAIWRSANRDQELAEQAFVEVFGDRITLGFTEEGAPCARLGLQELTLTSLGMPPREESPMVLPVSTAEESTSGRATGGGGQETPAAGGGGQETPAAGSGGQAVDRNAQVRERAVATVESVFGTEGLSAEDLEDQKVTLFNLASVSLAPFVDDLLAENALSKVRQNLAKIFLFFESDERYLRPFISDILERYNSCAGAGNQIDINGTDGEIAKPQELLHASYTRILDEIDTLFPLLLPKLVEKTKERLRNTQDEALLAAREQMIQERGENIIFADLNLFRDLCRELFFEVYGQEEYDQTVEGNSREEQLALCEQLMTIAVQTVAGGEEAQVEQVQPQGLVLADLKRLNLAQLHELMSMQFSMGSVSVQDLKAFLGDLGDALGGREMFFEALITHYNENSAHDPIQKEDASAELEDDDAFQKAFCQAVKTLLARDEQIFNKIAGETYKRLVIENPDPELRENFARLAQEEGMAFGRNHCTDDFSLLTRIIKDPKTFI